MKLRFKEFCDELANGRIMGLKCKGCGSVIFPPKAFCPECGSNDLEKVELSRFGTLKSFTVIRVAPEGFDPPYVVALVELPEGPMLMGNLNCSPEDVDLSLIGKEVEIGWKRVAGDKFSGGDGITFTFSLK